MAFLEFYKQGQGSRARLLAVVSGVALIIWGGFALWRTLIGSDALSSALLEIPQLGFDITFAFIIALLVTAGGIVGIAWIFNRPKTVDLLVETEAEMKKVSWPSRQEAWNSSLVVVVTVIVMMGLLFVYDVVLNFLIRQLLS